MARDQSNASLSDSVVGARRRDAAGCYQRQKVVGVFSRKVSYKG